MFNFSRGASDAACLYAISDALNSVFERYNIYIVDSRGYGYIDTYVNLATAFQIPNIEMVDKEYNGNMDISSDFYKLSGKLEDELVKIGLDVQTQGAIDPDLAHQKLFDAMQDEITRKKIRKNVIGKVFDRAMKKIHEEPDRIWRREV
jgi:hypothetical protein